MRDCPGSPSTTRTAEGPHSSGAAVVSSSGSGRPARAPHPDERRFQRGHRRARTRQASCRARALARPRGLPRPIRRRRRGRRSSPFSPVYDEQLAVVTAECGDRPLVQIGRNGRTSTPALRSATPVGARAAGTRSIVEDPHPQAARAGVRGPPSRREGASRWPSLVDDVILEVNCRCALVIISSMASSASLLIANVADEVGPGMGRAPVRPDPARAKTDSPSPPEAQRGFPRGVPDKTLM